MPAAFSGSSAIALVASWFVAVLFTPYLGVKLLPDFAKPGTHDDPDAIYGRRIYRALAPRRSNSRCRRRRIVVAVTVGAVRRLARRVRPGAAAVLPDLRPRPSCSSRCGCPRAPPSASPTRRRRRPKRMLAGDADIVDLHDLCRPGLAALLARPQSACCRTQNFAQIVIVTKDLDARERVKARLEAGDRRRRAAGGAGARRPLQLRPAGRLSRAVSRRSAPTR